MQPNSHPLDTGVPSSAEDADWPGKAAQAIAAMARACFQQAEESGFHDRGIRSVLEVSMLVVTECAELAEWERHGGGPSDHIPAFSGAEEEWADILVRVFDHSTEMGIDPERLGEAFVAKLRYNTSRGYRHGGKTI